jgi:two-component system response regulator YesN
MYKIMLADDEQIVLDSLKFIIRNQYGDECQVATARSGREAITQAESFHPDVAVMDINMPGINGIEAIKTIREISPATQFILLTAFDKFDYAKQAINLGVLEYLMKPVNKKRMIETLDMAIQLVTSTREKRMSELALKEKLENVRSILETGFFLTILIGSDQQAETGRYLELLDVSGPQGLIMTLEFGDRTADGVMQNSIGSHVRLNRDFQTLRTLIHAVTPCLVGPLLLNRIVIFLPVEAELITSQYSQAPALASQILKKVKSEIDTEMRMGISNSIESMGQLHDAYQQSIMALQQTPNEEICLYGNLIPAMNTDNPQRFEWLENSFLGAIRNGDTDLAVQYFRQLFKMFEQTGIAEISQVQAKVIEWLVLAGREASSRGQALNSGSQTATIDFSTLMAARDMPALRTYAVERLWELTTQMSGVRDRPVSDIIAQALTIIDKHYAGDISLESIADMIALSPPYFSRLFSNQVGKTFIDYLTDLRMSKACHLLQTTSLSIKEICAQVGYADPNYFSRIFKKIIGQTPTEYRS